MSGENNAAKPGAAALENMKLLKHESAIFKVPKIPKRREKKKSQVLDEDVYVQGIAKIIQRDFFPDLEKLKAQNEFLEATENKDYARLRELTRKYSGQRPPTEPYNSPATFDTPHLDRPFSPAAPTIRSDRPDSDTESVISDRSKDATDILSLDAYLSTHTSEDNASYDRVIALENKKRAAKLAAQLQSEMTSRAIADAALALPSIEQQADQTERPHELDTWRYTAKNYIMYVPDGAASQHAPPKPELVHHNTRLKTEPFDHVKNKEAISAIARSQDASVTGKIGVDGVSISSEKPGDAYPLVATPSPRPGEGPDQSPLMTWGEIEGTPFRLDGGDTPLPAVGAGAAYRMLEGGVRERIALQLAEQVAKRRRPTTPRVAPPTPSFRSNTERLASMSPAARKLAAKHLLSPRLKLTPNDMGILSHASPRRSPSPRGARPSPSHAARPSPSQAARPSPSHAARASRPLVARRPTPRVRTPRGLGDVGVTEDLTDNLLQINVAKRTRLKAKDFFK